MFLVSLVSLIWRITSLLFHVLLWTKAAAGFFFDTARDAQPSQNDVWQPMQCCDSSCHKVQSLPDITLATAVQLHVTALGRLRCVYLTTGQAGPEQQSQAVDVPAVVATGIADNAVSTEDQGALFKGSACSVPCAIEWVVCK